MSLSFGPDIKQEVANVDASLSDWIKSHLKAIGQIILGEKDQDTIDIFKQSLRKVLNLSPNYILELSPTKQDNHSMICLHVGVRDGKTIGWTRALLDQFSGFTQENGEKLTKKTFIEAVEKERKELLENPKTPQGFGEYINNLKRLNQYPMVALSSSGKEALIMHYPTDPIGKSAVVLPEIFVATQSDENDK